MIPLLCPHFNFRVCSSVTCGVCYAETETEVNALSGLFGPQLITEVNHEPETRPAPLPESLDEK